MASSLPATETMTYAERRMSGQVAFGYEIGRRRTSSFGAYTRVVVVAVDPSDHSKLAFDCKLRMIIFIIIIIIISQSIDRQIQYHACNARNTNQGVARKERKGQ